MAIAPHLLPLTLEDYLELPEDSDCEREIIRGRLFVAPRPLAPHQILLAYLHELLTRYELRRGGQRVQVIQDADLLMDAQNSYVSPDLMYFPPQAVPVLLQLMARRRRIHVFHARPDLVVEILSRGSEARDLVEKAPDYAAVGIPHYWAFDLEAREFHELVLPAEGGAYQSTIHRRGRIRPKLFAEQRPPFTLDLGRLWLDLPPVP